MPALLAVAEHWNRQTLCTVELIQGDDISAVEQVKGLPDEIQLSVLTDFEELQYTQIKLRLTGSSEGVPAKTQGAEKTMDMRHCGLHRSQSEG